MKVIKETPDGATLLLIEPDESILIFHGDGGHEAMMATPDDEEDDEEVAKASAVEVTIALIALADPIIRALIEEKITDA